MRRRVEDLGRICVMVDDILYMDLWDVYRGRNKDFSEFFRELNRDAQDTLLRNLIYGLDDVREKLFKISEIAEGNDRLNEPPQ